MTAAFALAATGGSAAATVATDPYASAQWGLATIKAPAAWTMMPQPIAETLVAVIDTGADVRHPDLAPRLWRSPEGLASPVAGRPLPAGSVGWDFVDNDADPSPEAARVRVRPAPAPTSPTAPRSPASSVPSAATTSASPESTRTPAS